MTYSDNPCYDCTALCCKNLIIEIQHIDVVREPSLLPVVTLMKTMDGDVDGDSEWDQQYNLACGSSHPCKMLSADDTCSIYKSRPNACVGFEAGGEHCNELREEAGLPPITKSK